MRLRRCTLLNSTGLETPHLRRNSKLYTDPVIPQILDPLFLREAIGLAILRTNKTKRVRHTYLLLYKGFNQTQNSISRNLLK